VGLASTPTDAFLTKVPSRNAASALNAFEYDLCFEFKPDDTLNSKLFTQSALRKNVFAWVWVAHETSTKEYKTALNIDITDPQKRFELLSHPDRNFFGAIDILLSPIRKLNRYSRSQLYMKKFDDGFPHDEQSMNFVEISQCLPFKSFSIGAQMGPVGISTMNTQYFDRHVNDHRIYTSTFLVDNKPSVHCKLDTDKNFLPDNAADRGVVLHGLELNLNEFYSRADNRFFFKEKSVSHWVNSLELQYPGSMYDNGMGTVFTKTKYPFTKGKLEILSHDFVKNYKTDNELLKRYSGSERFIEQKIIDLSSFESLHIAPAGEIKSEDGSFYARIGKGFPGQEKFTDTIHSKVYLKNDQDTWQAHAVCQRPLVLTYELDRDLTSEELQLLKQNPIQLLFWVGKPENKTAVKHKLMIDYEKASLKGSHAILLYLLTNDVKIEVSVDESGTIPAENYIMRDGAAARLFDCSCSLVKDFKYYTPENTGLFTGNPIIIVDDFQDDERKEKALSKIRKEYKNGINNASIKFLLGFIPGKIVGKGVIIGWDVFCEWQSKGKVTSKTAVDSFDKGLKIFLDDILKKKDPSGLLTYKDAEKITKTMKFAEQVSTITSTYIESSSLVSSPLFDGAGFGDKPQSDSLYLLSVGSVTFNIDPKTLVSSKVLDSGNFEFFKNREIVGTRPFNYQFGDTGGLLARDVTDNPDSLASFRTNYQEKLIAFKEEFSKEQAVTLPEYLKKLASNTPGEKFTDILKKIGANSSLISYFEGNSLAQKFKKGLNDGANLSDDEQVVLTTFLNLVMYIDASFAFCPACNSIVSLSWGWCPYHATRELLGLTDTNGDGKFKEEFNEALKRKFSDPTIRNMLTTSYKTRDGDANRDRLLVHWTEFVIAN
jgi:hypothetical protein